MTLGDEFQPCDDCNRPTDPNDAAPSCGSHVLCVSCYTTGDFRCRECLRVWSEVERDGGKGLADIGAWLARIAS